MKTVLEVKDTAFPIKLEQSSDGKFRVTYGQQVRSDLGYLEAAREFGLSYFHALACDGKLEN